MKYSYNKIEINSILCHPNLRYSELNLKYLILPVVCHFSMFIFYIVWEFAKNSGIGLRFFFFLKYKSGQLEI